MPAVKVRPPRIAECKTHLECVLDQHLTYGDEVILLGQIVAVSVDMEAYQVQDPYEYLRMLVYLEDATYGVIEQARQIDLHEESHRDE